MISSNLFAAYLLGFMLALTPVSKHAYYEKESVTTFRYIDIAQTIADVVMTEKMADDALVKVGAVMVSIGDAESGGWRADVVSCAKGGDNDMSWGPWQTQLPKAQVCEGTKSAARLALGMVKRSFLICKDLPSADRLSWYTDGGAWNASADRKARSRKRSNFRMNRALSWVAQHPFTVNVDSLNTPVIFEAP